MRQSMYRRKPKPKVQFSDHDIYGKAIFIENLPYQGRSTVCWFKPKSTGWKFGAQRDGFKLEGDQLADFRDLALDYLRSNGLEPFAASFEDIAALDPKYKQTDRGRSK